MNFHEGKGQECETNLQLKAFTCINWPSRAISVLIAYTTKSLLNVRGDVYSGARDQKLDLNFPLLPYLSYFLHAGSEGSGEGAQMRRLA